MQKTAWVKRKKKRYTSNVMHSCWLLLFLEKVTKKQGYRKVCLRRRVSERERIYIFPLSFILKVSFYKLAVK